MPTARILQGKFIFISDFSIFTLDHATATLSAKTSSSFVYNKSFFDISKWSSANSNTHKGGERHE